MWLLSKIFNKIIAVVFNYKINLIADLKNLINIENLTNTENLIKNTEK